MINGCTSLFYAIWYKHSKYNLHEKDLFNLQRDRVFESSCLFKLESQALQRNGRKNCSFKSKVFPLQSTSIEKGKNVGKMELAELLPLKVYQYPLSL